MSFIWFIARNVIFNTLDQPLPNLKSVPEIINRQWKKKNKKTCEVAIHFHKTPHILADFTFQCIDQIQNNTNQDIEKLLITKEAYWSAQVFSLFPYGLN